MSMIYPKKKQVIFFKVVPKIANALKEAFGPVGMNLLNNNGAPAGQTVFHFHLHFIPRYDQTDGFRPTWIQKRKHLLRKSFKI